MNNIKITQELSRNSKVIKELLKGLAKEEYLWKPAPEKWCLLEIICHLHDEECEDFRARTKHALETPTEELPSIDPAGWVKERVYIQQDFDIKLNTFLKERAASVKWLQALTHPKWDNAYEHSKFGSMSAKMFLSNWLAHDYLHIRQILQLKFEYIRHLTKEPLNYAGDW